MPTPGGVGGFEAAVQIGLTSFYAVPNDRAVGAAIVLHAVSLLPTIVLGFLFVIQDGLGFGGIRNLAHAAAEASLKSEQEIKIRRFLGRDPREMNAASGAGRGAPASEAAWSGARGPRD